MRSIAIIGAGQAGLQLGIGLVKRGYPVSLFTNRTAQQVLHGGIMSSQGMFNSAIKHERNLGISFWDADDALPRNRWVNFNLFLPPNSTRLQWHGRVSKPYQSVDQRLKFSRWMEVFEKNGGKLIIEDVDKATLDKVAKWHDLTVVSGGKGEISALFPRNDVLSHFDRPQRKLACLYVHHFKEDTKHPGVSANIIPNVGEFFVMPGLTISGPCHMLLFEAIVGKEFDCWDGITDPQERLRIAKELLERFLPEQAELCRSAELTDNLATLVGSYTPVIRQPTIRLPCGKPVLGMGDTIVLNDPIAGQGANNASKAAQLYMEAITNRGKAVFDEEWMKETFSSYWNNHAKWATKWTHMMLMPPEPHMISLLEAATYTPTIANKLADGFDDPSTLFPWISHPVDIERMIKFREKTDEHVLPEITQTSLVKGY